ncbi:hypothetical protein EJ02DRAFT_429884 [Clathrospora elynae]|uniref:Zinc finger PHD-type domain-containing protein n=1 Tax=Clathrospora elynae TaxID=706981 RepID=A0A6A5T5J6_9PLEO|nr:hypothetical protein EJ02DRAFT_429884 [Clathrospora elynae]
MASSGELAYGPTDRQHVAQQVDAGDGLYTCQQDLFSSHFVFPMPGQESGDALRSYLRKWWPALLSGADKNGEVRTMYDIPYDHALDLQAVLWRETSNPYVADLFGSSRYNGWSHGTYSQGFLGPDAPTHGGLWRDDRVLAIQVETIKDLLEENHIFVVRDGSKKDCDNPTCQETATTQTTRIPTIAVEPLIHWGTITPAYDLSIAQGRVFSFRRTGEKMKERLWTLHVRKILCKEHLTYCVECLEELMMRRAEAWAIIERRQRPAYYPAVHPIKRPISSTELYDRRGNGALETFGLKPAWNPVNQATGLTELCVARSWYDDGSEPTPLPQFDGASDSFYVPHHESSCCASEAMEDQENDLSTEWSRRSSHAPSHYLMKGHQPGSSRLSTASSTPPLGLVTIHDVVQPTCTRFPAYRIIHHRPSNSGIISTSTDRTRVFRDSQSEQYEKLGGKALPDSVPEFSMEKREFGRGIDTNSVRTCSYNFNKRRGGIAKGEGVKGGSERVFKPTPGPATENSGNGFGGFTPAAAEASPSNVRMAKADKVVYEESELSSAPSTLHNEEDPQAAAASSSPLNQTSTTKSPHKKLIPILNLPPTPTTKPKLQLLTADTTSSLILPVLRKRLSISPSQAPPTISQATYDAFQARTPEPDELICWCQKPARTGDVHLTQCVKKDCIVVWYHKECLDKRGKLQARFGTYLCDLCRNEEYFAGLGKKKENKTTTVVEGEGEGKEEGFSKAFTAREIVRKIPGIGGFVGMERPYGFGTQSETGGFVLAPPARGVRQGHSARALSHMAVGSMPSLGYPISRPHFVNQAYTNTQTHMKEADKAYEDTQLRGYHADQNKGGDEDDEEDAATLVDENMVNE